MLQKIARILITVPFAVEKARFDLELLPPPAPVFEAVGLCVVAGTTLRK